MRAFIIIAIISVIAIVILVQLEKSSGTSKPIAGNNQTDSNAITHDDSIKKSYKYSHNKLSYVSAPSLSQFSLLCTGRVNANTKQPEITNAIKASTFMQFSESRKTIAFVINTEAGENSFQIHWDNYSIEPFESGKSSFFIQYDGYDGSGNDAQAIIYYSRKKKLNAVVIRTKSNTEGMMFLNP